MVTVIHLCTYIPVYIRLEQKQKLMALSNSTRQLNIKQVALLFSGKVTGLTGSVHIRIHS